MKPANLTKKILKTLLEITADSFYLFVAISESGYGASQKKIEQRFWEIKEGKLSGKEKNDFLQRRNNFYSYLYKLQKDGLVEKRRGKWSITSAGRGKYKILLSRLPVKKYQKQPDATFKIIIFDIPEKEKNKRRWLRERLIELGFKMLQKSVWMGKVKLPQEFMEDLRDLHLLSYVEIFSITKKGSIRFLG